MIVSIIVAHDLERAIGIDNQLPWHLPADLAYFKKITSGHTIIMGRKTYESIGRPLPKRRNIVLSRSHTFVPAGVEVMASIDDAIQACAQEEEVFIIGGANIYEQALPIAQRLYITLVQTTVASANAHFPKINTIEWRLISQSDHYKDDLNPFDYSFKILERSS